MERVRSSRSVDAFGVTRSWGSTPPAPSSTTSSPAEDTDDVPVRAGGVGEAHPVDRERRGVVGHEHRRVDPGLQRVGGPLVPVGSVGFPGNVDVGDVVDAPRPEFVEVGVGQHVIRRSDEIVDDAIPVAEGGERSEPGHGPTMPPPAPATATITRR